MVERFHRPLKNALKARLSDSGWMTELPLVLLGLRSAWREDADCTPADLVFGASLRLPGQMFEPQQNSNGLQRTWLWPSQFMSGMMLFVAPYNGRMMVHSE